MTQPPNVPPGQYPYYQYGAPPGPALPPPRRSRRTMWTVIVICAALAAGAVTAGIVLAASGSSPGPEKVARDYLTALANGDAAAALQASSLQPPSTMYLTDEILAKQQAQAKIANIKVGAADANAGSTTVPVSYTFGPKEVHDDLRLFKTGGRWLIDQTFVMFSLPRNISGLTLFGRPVRDEHLYVFPGPLELGSSDPNLRFGIKANEFPTTPNNTYLPNLTVSLSEDARHRAIAAVSAKLKACARTHEDFRSGCPQELIGQFEPGTARWHIVSNLSRALKATLEGFDLSSRAAHVVGRVEWSVTYQAGDSETPLTTRHDTDSTLLDVQVDVTTSPPTVTGSLN